MSYPVGEGAPNAVPHVIAAVVEIPVAPLDGVVDPV